MQRSAKSNGSQKLHTIAEFEAKEDDNETSLKLQIADCAVRAQFSAAMAWSGYPDCRCKVT